ncbi:LEAF RUST 10 DISEASE-RESISTANCE LOCUS RECEPTOR-LIKE PROTEIN KINASE-like 2.1 [Sesamum alatum]|uniref:LEAF RUST 10 DISEASE-RESISTANCE LOCUS RECEPTOR-LIKE PROTEIN KINASE-like 2.1 n=1 Tax=Sesamum alatum TaxID=300844 RepID=A0AAE2CLJ6_9LAMI|nr:LEAF RUST 10 DISEASE-RESISTANCE LOCUS RECEPTOR-LIKE PROTEIN KINASE-like 2.1 [Sesamum alatum]
MHTKPSQKLFLFLLATLLLLHFPGFYSQQDECSRQPFQCGNISNITYPFWGDSRPQACGLSGFQLLNCEGDFPLLYIPPLIYRVLEFDFSNRTLKVARQDLLNGACPTTFYNTTLQDPYDFAHPGYNDEQLTLFYHCIGIKNFSLLGCIDLFRIGNASSGPGPNITCSHSISVPVNQTAAQALKNRKASNVLQEALSSGFVIKYSPFCDIQFYGDCIPRPVTAAAPPPVYQEGVPRGIPTAGSPNLLPALRRRLNAVEVIGKSVVLVSFIIIIVSVIICCCCLKRRLALRRNPNKEHIEKFLLQHGSLALKRYKYSEIKKITKSFNDKLGRGGYGSVYQGVLPDGCPVAVKVLIDIDNDGEEFVNEVASISRTSHVNIVNLLGFCYDRNKRALVYEFMANKSLDKFISNNADCQLDRETLYKIAIGVSKGLEYLHIGCNTRIVHFDIKPQNILLDGDFCPKISDFGLAKLCKKKQSILSVLGARGTIGYIAPEVFSRNYGGVSHKSDVYSYGMMVLEMAGARKTVEPKATQSSENYFPDRIYEQVVLNVTTNSDDLMIEEEEETTRKMFLVAFWCIQTNPSDRPSMSKVVEMLEGSLEFIPIPPKPFLFTPSFPISGLEFSSTLSAYVEIENSADV